jgi:uncharacterized protein YecE (DUF72 family)
MQLHAGTSGFSYAEWKGKFYPAGTKEADFLRYYASKFDTVEINNTFYRMPKRELLSGWNGKVPPDFLFVLKASQRITHRGKLENTEENVAYFWSVAQELGPRLGPVLFQLPPYLRKDTEKLKRFLASLPTGLRAVLEFRHRSWFEDDEALRALRDHGATLCFSDVDPSDDDDPGLEQPFEATTDWGYVRLRRGFYEEAQLRAWMDRIKANPWREVFVFFKHETTGPDLALQLKAIWS